MEMRGIIKLEDLFRANYKLSKEIDIFVLIQEAISAASLGNPEEFMRKRSSLAETLFRDPRSCPIESYVEDEDNEHVQCDDHREDSRRNNLHIIASVDASSIRNRRSGNDGGNMPEEAKKTGRDRETSTKHCADDNGNKMARGCLIKSSERPEKEVTTDQVNNKFDENEVRLKLERSIKEVESKYQQIQQKRKKIQVLDVKDLPPPKSRHNNIRQRRSFPSFKKQQRFRPVCA